MSYSLEELHNLLTGYMDGCVFRRELIKVMKEALEALIQEEVIINAPLPQWGELEDARR